MTKARIVFSDGSKQMSHNLDDLRERWQMRRQEEQAKIDDGLNIQLIAPQLGDNWEVLTEQRFTVLQAKQETEQQLALMNGTTRKTAAEKATRARLAAQAMYYTAALTCIDHKREPLRPPALAPVIVQRVVVVQPKEHKINPQTKVEKLRATKNGRRILGIIEDELRDSRMADNTIVANAVETARETRGLLREAKARIKELEAEVRRLGGAL